MRESIVIRPHWLWMIPILLLAYALAIPYLQTHALWYDEIFTHIQSGTGLLQHTNMTILDTIISTALKDYVWPPLYYIVQNIWSRFSGHTLVSEHMLTLLTGVITVAVVYRFGKALFGEKGGILTALLFSTSAFYIHYMHETRAYTLYTLFIALTGWFYWLLVNRDSIQQRWLRWSFPLVIAAALYTHYVAGAFILGIAAYHVLVQYRKRGANAPMNPERWWLITRLWFNGCLLFSPWIAVLIPHIMDEASIDRALPFVSLMQSAVYIFSNNLWIITAPILLASLFFWKKREVLFLWIWSIFAIIVIIVVNNFASFLFHPRHIIPLLLIFILMLVPVLMEIDKRINGLSAIFIGLYAGAGIVFSFTPSFMAQIPAAIPLIPLVTILEMEEVIEQCVEEGDAVIYSLSEPEFELMKSVVIEYYDLKEVKQYSQLGELTAIVSNDFTSWQLLDNLEASRTIMDFANGNNTIWVMSLPDLANQSNIMLLDSVLTQQNNYRKCPALETSKNADIWSYTRSENSCNLSC